MRSGYRLQWRWRLAITPPMADRVTCCAEGEMPLALDLALELAVPRLPAD